MSGRRYYDDATGPQKLTEKNLNAQVEASMTTSHFNAFLLSSP